MVATDEFLGAKACMHEQIENETEMPASICLRAKIYGRLKTLQKVFISGNTRVKLPSKSSFISEKKMTPRSRFYSA